MKLRAHKNTIKPMLTGALCMLFIVIMISHGCVQMVVAK